MKKISTLLLLTTAAVLLSGCAKGSAATDEPDSSKVTTINIDAMFDALSSSKPAAPAPADNTPSGDSPQISESSESIESTENPPESSEPEDRDDDAYYTYMRKGAGVMIMGGENEKEHIEIPATINERTVVSVSGSAKKTLFPRAKTIVLPDTITEISSYAFAGCTYLSEINIPNGVEKIGEGAFMGCASLTSIALPDSVTSIAPGAFDANVEFSISYKGMTFNPNNISDLYSMLS